MTGSGTVDIEDEVPVIPQEMRGATGYHGRPNAKSPIAIDERNAHRKWTLGPQAMMDGAACPPVDLYDKVIQGKGRD